MEEKKRVYSLKALAEMLDVSVKTIARWRANGQIGFSQIGSTILFTQEDVDAFMAAYHHTPYAMTTDSRL